MNDDSFRLTPIDVRHQTFTRGMRGYDMQQVEDFKVRVAEELDRLTRSNQDLEAKARGFHEQLRAFRERDKALNDALVSAQQLRGDIREQAEREAQLVVREARAEAERIVEQARADARRLAEEVQSLERMRKAQLAQLRALAERQLAEIVAAEQTLPTAADLAHLAPGGRAPGEQHETRPSYPTPAWLDRVEEP